MRERSCCAAIRPTARVAQSSTSPRALHQQRRLLCRRVQPGRWRQQREFQRQHHHPGKIFIGNSQPGDSTSVSAAGLNNNGRLELQGDVRIAPTGQTTLTINGVSSANVTGVIRVGGNAELALTTKITAVLKGGTLELDGATARISKIGGTTFNSGIDTFANNYGTFILSGNANAGTGTGGVMLTTVGTAFTNLGTFQMDAQFQEGGSTFSVGGAFVNSGTATIGNSGNITGAPTQMSATAFVNYGTIDLLGNAIFPTTLQVTAARILARSISVPMRHSTSAPERSSTVPAR